MMRRKVPAPWMCLLTVLLVPVLPVEAASEAPALSVDITTHLGDDQEFRQGDEIRLLVSLSEPAWLLILYQDAAGRLIQILPNSRSPRRRYDAGSYFPIPDKAQPFVYRVAEPYGQEYAWVIAGAQPVPELAGKVLPNGLRLLTMAAPAGPDDMVRALGLQPGAVAVARVGIRTGAR